MRNVPSRVKESAKRIAEKIDDNDYKIFYRNGKKKWPTNSFLAWFTGNHFYELQRKNIDVRDARKVRAYLHQNQKSSEDFGPEILTTSGVKRTVIVALILLLSSAFAYYKFIYQEETKEEEIFRIFDAKQWSNWAGEENYQSKELFTVVKA